MGWIQRHNLEKQLRQENLDELLYKLEEQGIIIKRIRAYPLANMEAYRILDKDGLKEYTGSE